jgi:hypothetical protein
VTSGVDDDEEIDLESRFPATSLPAPRVGLSIVAFGGLASVAAGAIHAAAVGIHSETPQLSQVFVLVAVLQIGIGVWALARPTRAAACGVVVANALVVTGWAATRLVEISWIDGLQVRESPQFADTACAALGLVAVVAAGVGAVQRVDDSRRMGLIAPAVLLGALTVWTMMATGTHSHSSADAAHGTDAAGAGHGHGDDGGLDAASVAEASGVVEPTISHHDDAATVGTSTDGHGHANDAEGLAMVWPRPWDPSRPIDVSGVEGVSRLQERRAVELIEATLRELPKYADPAAAVAVGYTSIGDAGTGTEHYIKSDLIDDDVLLDPTAPESLVYAVDGDRRTLAGAMYIASPRPADDPTLTQWAGPLMTWHKHDNLCWAIGDDGEAEVVGVIDGNGNCANGVRAGGESPMVHVWIQPHPCGVFAALEGIGAGTAAVSAEQRVDMCSADHDHGASATARTASSQVPRPYDPTMPIDLSGTPGVTPRQQAAAENLIATTVVRLPKWSDHEVAEAFGFRSIGDGGTGHEHFIQWDWIDDDVILDPDRPESLVFEPQLDGSKKLVAAMYMLPTSVALEDVPDIGGDLMQWHIHDDLCYTNDPEAPKVVGLTNPDGTCPAGLVKHTPAPMIHVWITPHRCGPFAALDGVGAGQIAAGETRLCDHRHGSGR